MRARFSATTSVALSPATATTGAALSPAAATTNAALPASARTGTTAELHLLECERFAHQLVKLGLLLWRKYLQ